MNFKTSNDKRKIEAALDLCYSLVAQVVRSFLVKRGFGVRERGKDLSLIYEIQKDGSTITAEFHFHNLFLEITTQNRDAQFLEFDEGLLDFGYFIFKALKLVESKMEPLLLMLSEDNPTKGIEKMMKLAPNYERLTAAWKDKEEKNH